jgi:tetratricopeptide (TPR) repeat protein
MYPSMHRLAVIVACFAAFVSAGCSAPFHVHRERGKRMMAEGRYWAALDQFQTAREMVPEHANNLCDLAECHLELARECQARHNEVAAAREMDQAVQYYKRAIRAYPGYERALQGENLALELRGKQTEALGAAQWAARNVGPSADQQVFLARQLAERGDADRALLAYKQAVAMEPRSADAQEALALYYIELQRPREAIPHLQTAYSLNPRRTDLAARLRDMGAQVPVPGMPGSPSLAGHEAPEN